MSWTPDDLTNYGDEALDELRVAVLTEQERRTRLAAIPAQVTALATAYLADGGDQAQLEAAIVPAEQQVTAPIEPATT